MKENTHVKRILLLLLAMMMVLSMSTGCARGTGEDVIEIAVVPKALDNAIFLDTKAAAEAKGKELGIKIYWEGPTTSDAAMQVNIIESLIERQVDGILISCNDADALKDVINRAIEAGISVACFDSDSPESNRLFYCGTDNYAIGKLAAEKLMQYLPDGGKVAILTGVLGAPNLETRLDGFAETLTAAGSKIELLPVQTGEDDVQKSVEVVTQYTAANPDLAGWFFAGGWPYFADPDALHELKTFMEKGGHIVSIDASYPMMQFVGMNMVDVLIGQNYTAMGSLGVELLYKIIKGEEVDLGDESHYIDTGYELVDINNYEEVWASKTPW